MSKSRNMLEGSLWDKILLFALPLAASSILQQLFNSADVAVVGQFAGSHALAAVGANGPIINLLVTTFVGISVGTNVIVSNYIGQDRIDKSKLAVHTSILFSIIMGLFLMVFGFFVAPLMLEMISTPTKILNLAVLYLRIYFIGVPFILLYNFEAAILRSRGETKTPLIALAISGVVNIVLNIILVVCFHMSVDGVAIATVISNVISSAFLSIYLLKDTTLTHVDLKELRINLPILRQILKIGVPAGMQGQSSLFLMSLFNQQ